MPPPWDLLIHLPLLVLFRPATGVVPVTEDDSLGLQVRKLCPLVALKAHAVEASHLALQLAIGLVDVLEVRVVARKGIRRALDIGHRLAGLPSALANVLLPLLDVNPNAVEIGDQLLDLTGVPRPELHSPDAADFVGHSVRTNRQVNNMIPSSHTDLLHLILVEMLWDIPKLEIVVVLILLPLEI